MRLDGWYLGVSGGVSISEIHGAVVDRLGSTRCSKLGETQKRAMSQLEDLAEKVGDFDDENGGLETGNWRGWEVVVEEPLSEWDEFPLHTLQDWIAELEDKTIRYCTEYKR
ncbi:hypothetical protein BDW02DRAFT_563760 [Decorospora gaudefroyi]|uniref:Uncharacterized protein n=1 Tax=Decorospora gaudefroyi TaxID=184978 RepID=A0A6A5KTU0_9PLEO|nr:hypothetical protein BDW02DRAFT_563760 [Decorospora gaudefroyi]